MPSPSSGSTTPLRDQVLALLRKLYHVRLHHGGVTYTKFTQAQIAEELGYSPSQFSRLMQPTQSEDGLLRLLTRLQTVDQVHHLQKRQKGLVIGLAVALFVCLLVLLWSSLAAPASTSNLPISAPDGRVLLLNRSQLEPVIANHLKRMNYQVTTRVMSFVGNYREGDYSEEVIEKHYDLLIDEVFSGMMEGREDLKSLNIVLPDGRNIVELLPDRDRTKKSLEQVFAEAKPLLLQPDFGFNDVRELVLKESRDEQAKSIGLFWSRWEEVASQYTFPEPETVYVQTRERLSKSQREALTELYNSQVQYRMAMAGGLFNASIKAGAVPPEGMDSHLNELKGQIEGILLDSRELIERLDVQAENGRPYYDIVVENSENNIDTNFSELAPVLLNEKIELSQLANMIRAKIERIQDENSERFDEGAAQER